MESRNQLALQEESQNCQKLAEEAHFDATLPFRSNLAISW